MKLVRSKPHIEQQKTIRIEDKKEELFFEARIIVRKARQNGYPDEAIRQGFKNKGWKDEDINKIMI
jgi:hypothetical protein